MKFTNNDFIELIRLESNEIENDFRKASLEGKGTPQEISDRRELSIKLFLEKFFPFPYRIAKGGIIDSFGNRSNSIDAIILNPIHPYTVVPNSDKYSLILADGVDAVIEIKPKLIADEIERSLKQIISVKKLKRRNSPYLLSANYNKQAIEYSKQLPCFVFSIESYSNIQTLVERIVNFYVEEKTPKENQFDFICINKNCLIRNYRNDNIISHKNGFEGIAIGNYGVDSLSALLLELNRIHKSEATIQRPILNHYLDDKLSNLQTFNELNEKLLSI